MRRHVGDAIFGYISEAQHDIFSLNVNNNCSMYSLTEWIDQASCALEKLYFMKVSY